MNIFIFLLLQAYSIQSGIEIPLGQTKDGQLKNDYNFYYVSFDYTKIHVAIQLRVYSKEEKVGFQYLFASLDNEKPDKVNFNWSSTNTEGNNYITITNGDLVGKSKIYFSVFCEDQCDYYVSVKEDNSIAIPPNLTVFAGLEFSKDFLFTYRNRGKPFEFDIYSPEGTRLNVSFYKNKEDLENGVIIPIYPSFISGYGASIDKESDYYCNECLYYLKVSQEESADHMIKSSVYVSFNEINEFEVIDEKFPLFDQVSLNSRHCYEFTIPQNTSNDSLILTLAVFSGKITLDLNPGTFTSKQEDSLIFKKVSVSNVFKFTSSELNLANNSKVFMCVNGVKNSSYMIKVFMETHTEETSNYNFLIDGISIPSYVPAGKATKFRIADFGKTKKGLEINLYIKNGTPKLYGLFCEDFTFCSFSFNAIHKGNFKGKIDPNYSDATFQSIYIEKDKYNCDGEKAKYCGIHAVVMCEGQIECEFDIGFNLDETYINLKENTPTKELLSNNDFDFYQFSIENDDIENVSIVLNDIAGESKMFIERSKEALPKVKDISKFFNY